MSQESPGIPKWKAAVESYDPKGYQPTVSNFKGKTVLHLDDGYLRFGATKAYYFLHNLELLYALVERPEDCPLCLVFKDDFKGFRVDRLQAIRILYFLEYVETFAEKFKDEINLTPMAKYNDKIDLKSTFDGIKKRQSEAQT